MKIRKELYFGLTFMALVVIGAASMLLSVEKVTNGHLGLLMFRFSRSQFVPNYCFIPEHYCFSFASLVIAFFYFPFLSPCCFYYCYRLISLFHVQSLFLICYSVALWWYHLTDIFLVEMLSYFVFVISAISHKTFFRLTYLVHQRFHLRCIIHCVTGKRNSFYLLRLSICCYM